MASAERENRLAPGRPVEGNVPAPAEQIVDPAASGLDPTLLVTSEFLSTAHALFAAGSVGDTLARVAALAVATIEGCDFATIFGVQLPPGPVVTALGAPPSNPGRSNRAGSNPVPPIPVPPGLVATNPIVARLDGLQQRGGEGPSVDAVAQGSTFYAEDLADDSRWPNFGPEAAAQGVRSLLSLSLSLGGNPVGALNLYAEYPQAFGVIDRARGLLLAALAGLAVSAARTHEDQERQRANLQAALVTRELVGQAQGILMERERITADQAFDILRRASQHLNLRLREVAKTLIETGERPDTGHASSP